MEAELAALLTQDSERRTEDRNAVVVCNGHLIFLRAANLPMKFDMLRTDVSIPDSLSEYPKS